MPSFFIDTFGVPPFLLPIYQAAGIEYGVRWEILAAINAIETDYGRNLNVSSAGAVGWMQFLPSTWELYGIDGNADGRADPYNPVDAIFSAARYLNAAGAERDLRAAIFAYNHADWYVDDVLARARMLAGLPGDLVSALSGLAQARPPVLGLMQPASPALAGEPERTLALSTRPGAPVVAVADGKVVEIGLDPRLGRFVTLRDVFGNTYTYGGLGSLAARYPVLDDAIAWAASAATALPEPPAPSAQPTAGELPALGAPAVIGGVPVALGRTDWGLLAQQLAATAPRAHPAPRGHPPTKYDRRLLGGVSAADVRYRELRPGARILAGTILAHAARTSATKTGQISFEIRPAGRNSPLIEPRPVVAGWKLLARAARRAPRPGGAVDATIGQLLLLDRQALQRRVLADRRIELGPCDRDRIRAGRIDRRVLAALELLAVADLHPTVSALQCGLTRIAATGKVSRHWTGDAVDISAINNIPVLGNQGPGSISELAVRRLLLLQGSMKPDHIMSLVRLDGADNTLMNASHPDHIHIGFRHALRNRSIATRISDGSLEASAWRRLGGRLGAIDNPAVRAAPSRYARAVVTDPRAGTADPPAAP